LITFASSSVSAPPPLYAILSVDFDASLTSLRRIEHKPSSMARSRGSIVFLQRLGTQSTDQNRQFAASVYRPDDQCAKLIRQALLYV
jgi:hypothetical protein